MRPGREYDVQVAQKIFGFEVFVKNKVLHEKTEQGDRPLRPYSRDMEWAWTVAEKTRISIVPIEGNQWFAFASAHAGWESPEAFLEYLKNGDFSACGAFVSENPAEAICRAALVAIDKQQKISEPISQVLN